MEEENDMSKGIHAEAGVVEDRLKDRIHQSIVSDKPRSLLKLNMTMVKCFTLETLKGSKDHSSTVGY